MSIKLLISNYSNLIFASIYGYALYYDYNLSKSFKFYPVPGQYWSKLVWLTMINLYLHFFYHAIGALLALLHVRRPELLRPFHFVATVLVFPIGFTVVLLFWGLVYCDPNFLVDDAAKIILAIKWFNHSIHTLPLLATLVDFAVWRHPRPSKSSAFGTILVFVLLYMIDIHYFYLVHGVWAYPILALLPWPARLLFLLFCMFVVFGAFLLGDALNAGLHALLRRLKKEQKQQKKKEGKTERTGKAKAN